MCCINTDRMHERKLAHTDCHLFKFNFNLFNNTVLTQLRACMLMHDSASYCIKVQNCGGVNEAFSWVDMLVVLVEVLEKSTFQIIDGLLQLGHRPLCKLCAGLSLRHKPQQRVNAQYEISLDCLSVPLVHTGKEETETQEHKSEENLTSFSLSVRTLISSSYLSSFCEYWNQNIKRYD